MKRNCLNASEYLQVVNFIRSHRDKNKFQLQQLINDELGYNLTTIYVYNTAWKHNIKLPRPLKGLTYTDEQRIAFIRDNPNMSKRECAQRLFISLYDVLKLCKLASIPVTGGPGKLGASQSRQQRPKQTKHSNFVVDGPNAPYCWLVG